MSWNDRIRILSVLPNGFELIEYDPSTTSVYTKYINSMSNEVISFYQHTKKGYNPHYNTEHNNLEEIKINGHGGLCIYFSENEYSSSIIVWDNDE